MSQESRMPWEGEPDFVLFSHLGLPCLVARSTLFGHLNGYVGVPAGHPLYGKSYSDVDVRVHGGLSYSGTLNGFGFLDTLLALYGRPRVVWWFGFDCGHSSDVVPSIVELGLEPLPNARYRTLAYVQGQCRKLASQLASVYSGKGGKPWTTTRHSKRSSGPSQEKR